MLPYCHSKDFQIKYSPPALSLNQRLSCTSVSTRHVLVWICQTNTWRDAGGQLRLEWSSSRADLRLAGPGCCMVVAVAERPSLGTRLDTAARHSRWFCALFVAWACWLHWRRVLARLLAFFGAFSGFIWTIVARERGWRDVAVVDWSGWGCLRFFRCDYASR